MVASTVSRNFLGVAPRKALTWLTEHELELPADARRQFVAFHDALPDSNHREAALMGAALYLVGDVAPEHIGAALASHRHEVDECFAVARAVGQLAVAAGEPEARVAEALGVDRMTLRKWQGKR